MKRFRDHNRRKKHERFLEYLAKVQRVMYCVEDESGEPERFYFRGHTDRIAGRPAGYNRRSQRRRKRYV